VQTANDVIHYIDTTPSLNTFFTKPPLNINEIGDGNLNFIFQVQDASGASLIIKHAPPYLRLLGESFPLPQERICVEMHTMSYFQKIAPSYTPKLYLCDEKAFVLAMEYLEGYELLQSAQLKQTIDLHLYAKLGDFLARLYKHAPRHMEEGYYEEATLKSISEHYIFRYPYIQDHPALVVPDFFTPLSKSVLFHENLQTLLELFLTHKEALIHGDLHTGSILIKDANIAIIDAEFSFFGPLGFDIGTLLAHILFGEIYALYEHKTLHYRSSIRTLWHYFEHQSAPTPLPLLQQSVGFCGAELFRRLVVPAKAKPLESISTENGKENAYKLCEKLSIELIENFLRVKSLEDFMLILEKHLCLETH